MSDTKMQQKTSAQSTIGTILRTRREALGWSEQDVAAHLRIQTIVLSALERDDYQALPGQAYVIGFLKSYAALLGLDSESIIESFKKEATQKHLHGLEKPTLSFPQTGEERSLPKWALITVGLAVVFAAYGGWYHFSSHDEGGSETASSSFQAADTGHSEAFSPVASNPAPVTTSGTIGAVAPSEQSSPEDGAEAFRSSSEGSPASDNPFVAGAVPARQDSVTATTLSPSNTGTEATSSPEGEHSPFVTQQPASPTSDSVSGAAKPVSGELPPHVIELHFIKDSWTKISDQSGKLLESRVFRAGETWQGDGAAAPYSVTAGNAAGVILRAGNVTSAPLGQAGQVKRNIPISAETVTQGTFGHGTLPDDEPTVSEKTGEAPPVPPKTLEQSGGTD